jgi:uncharacterized membrane protein
MGIIGVIQNHNRNKELKKMRELQERNGEPQQKNDAIETIKMRYAKGEITKEEYEEMKRDFESW